jgi:hypothetical protein
LDHLKNFIYETVTGKEEDLAGRILAARVTVQDRPAVFGTVRQNPVRRCMPTLEQLHRGSPLGTATVNELKKIKKVKVNFTL